MPQLPFQLPASDFTLAPGYQGSTGQNAQDRLLWQYKQPKIQALIAALATPAQDLEDAFTQIYTERWIATAVGKQLDVLGRIVGLKRQGLDDVSYRTFLTAQILVLKSSGAPEEIYKIFSLVVPGGTTMRIDEYFPAAFVLTLTGAVTAFLAALFIQLLRSAKAGGVNTNLLYSQAPAASTFTFNGTAAQGFNAGTFAGVLN